MGFAMRLLNHRAALFSAALVAVVAGGAFMAAGAVPSPTPSAVRGTPTSPVSRTGVVLQTAAGLASSAPEIHMTAPQAGAQPGLSREAAINAALWTGATLREAVLVELTSPYSGSEPRLVWAISQMPPGGIVRPSGGPMGMPLHLPAADVSGELHRRAHGQARVHRDRLTGRWRRRSTRRRRRRRGHGGRRDAGRRQTPA